MKKRIYAYYESLQVMPQNEEFACSNVWKATWEKQGWECIMLNKSHARNSPHYQKLMTKLVKLSPQLPPEISNAFPKIVARYARWCALHAANGGWMSDYDVANIAFTPNLADEQEKNGTLQVISGEPCYLMYATKDHCAAAINKILMEDLHLEGTLKTEADILGKEGMQGVKELLFHAVKTPEKLRSEAMKDYLS